MITGHFWVLVILLLLFTPLVQKVSLKVTLQVTVMQFCTTPLSIALKDGILTFTINGNVVATVTAEDMATLDESFAGFNFNDIKIGMSLKQKYMAKFNAIPAELQAEVSNANELASAQIRAANVNQSIDGKITSGDYLLLANYVLGRAEL